MFKLFILFSSLFVNIARAESIDTNLINYANHVPLAIQKNHVKLSSYLIQPCKTETEKVLIFSYWIPKRIRYDLKELKENDRNKIAREVLANRKAVCGGYSNLFQQFCDNEKILCFKISGYAWGNFFEKTLSATHCAHAWNVVYADGKWQCIDVTWSTNTLKDSKFRKDQNLEWVFTDPKEFAKTHYPMDPRWQLLNDPLTKREFWKKTNIIDRQYNSSDSLNALLKNDWIQNRIISIKGEFVEQKDPTKYIKNLTILGWDLVGGPYNLNEIKRAKIVFNLTYEQYNKLAPFLGHKSLLNSIKSGLWLCRRRMEMKE